MVVSLLDVRLLEVPQWHCSCYFLSLSGALHSVWGLFPGPLAAHMSTWCKFETFVHWNGSREKDKFVSFHKCTISSKKNSKNLQKNITKNLTKNISKKIATQAPKVPLHFSVPSLTLPSLFFTRRQDANRCCLSFISNWQPFIDHKGLAMLLFVQCLAFDKRLHI